MRGHLDHHWDARVAALGDPPGIPRSPGESVGLPETEVQRRRPPGMVLYSARAVGVLLAARSVWLLLAVPPLASVGVRSGRPTESARAVRKDCMRPSSPHH